MKTTGLLIVGFIVFIAILILTFIIEVIELFVGAILFVVAMGFFIYLYKKAKDTLD